MTPFGLLHRFFKFPTVSRKQAVLFLSLNGGKDIGFPSGLPKNVDDASASGTV